MKHQVAWIAFVLVLFSCKKENIDLQNNILADVATAANRTAKKALPKRIWHAYGSYTMTWDFFYNKRGEVDSIDQLVESFYYGQWRMGYKVYYSGPRIDSVTRTQWGYPMDILQNIKYDNGLIVEADLYLARIFNNPPVKWKIEYDKKKRPLNSPLGEQFYYNEKGQLTSYTHPISPVLNSSFISDSKDNPMHQIPNLNIILLNEYETAMAWYNPNNVTLIKYTNGVNVEVNNTFDYFGKLIVKSYDMGVYTTSQQWNFVY
jgi:hypothetical protein